MTKAAQTLDSGRAACNSCHLLSPPPPSPLFRQPSYALSNPLLPLRSISRMVMPWDKSKWVCAWPLGLGWMSWFGAFGSVSAPDKVHGWGGGDGSKDMGRQLQAPAFTARIHIEGLHVLKLWSLGCINEHNRQRPLLSGSFPILRETGHMQNIP